MAETYIRLIKPEKRLSKKWFDTANGQKCLEIIHRIKRSGDPIGYCDCQTDNLVPLTVARSPKQLYFIKNFPDQRHLHKATCSLGTGAFQTRPGQEDQAGVINALEDGNFQISLRVPLKRSDFVEPNGNPTPDPVDRNLHQRRPGQRNITPSYLLDFLWEQARLHFWSPKMRVVLNGKIKSKRNSFTVEKHLMEAASLVRCTRRTMFNDIFHSLITEKPAKDIVQLWERVFETSIRPYLLLRLNIDNPIFGKDYYLQPAWMRKAKIRVRVEEALYDRLIKHLTVKDNVSEVTRLAFVQVEAHQSIHPETRQPTRYFRVVDGTFRAYSKSYLPVHSTHELQLTDRLVDQNRKFTKPLIRSGFKYLPDFVLHDVHDDDFPLEVFGFTSDEYMLRRAEKTVYYNQTLGSDNWWFWDPEKQVDIPLLPEKRTESQGIF